MLKLDISICKTSTIVYDVKQQPKCRLLITKHYYVKKISKFKHALKFKERKQENYKQ